MILGTAGKFFREEVLSKEENEKMLLELKDKYVKELLKQFVDVEISFIQKNQEEIVKVWVLERGNTAYKIMLNVDLLEFYLEKFNETILDAINQLIKIKKLKSYIVRPEQLFIYDLIERCDFEERLYIDKFNDALVIDDMKINLTKIETVSYDREDEDLFMIVADIAYFINLDEVTVHIEYYN